MKLALPPMHFEEKLSCACNLASQDFLVRALCLANIMFA